MNRNHLWKLLLILFVVGWSAYEMYPPSSRPLIEVFQENYQRRDTNYTAIMEQFKILHAANPQNDFKNLLDAVGTNTLVGHFDFDTRAEKDPNAAILNHLQKLAAGKIKLGLDLQGGSSFLVEMQTGKLATNMSRQVAIDNAVEVLRKRVDRFGVAEPVIQPVGQDRIEIQMPGLSEAVAGSVRVAISKAAFLEFRLVHEDNKRQLELGIVPPGYEIMKEARDLPDGRRELIPHVVSKSRIPGLSGKNLTRAGVIRGNLNDPQIAFTFDTEGAATFGRVTTENRGRQLAIILDGELYSAPNIDEPITGGNGVIRGSFGEKEAFDLAAILQNPLEAPVTSSRSARSIHRSAKTRSRAASTPRSTAPSPSPSFMAIYYMFAGMVANVALLLNIVILLGVMCSFGTTLTLPGIAGIVLTVGMAVDANVLIFERIREESGKGKSLRGALAAGYSRAFGTIFDSHVTTLISSVILIYMGTGTIKGFGVALTIGVAASLFTALVVTRLIFDFLIWRGWMKTLPMLHIIRSANVDFMRWAKPAFIASWMLIIIGIGYGFYRGKHMVGFEFTGGDNLTISFAQKIDVDKVREAVTPVAGEALIQYQRELTGTTENLRVSAGFDTSEKIINALTTKFPEAGFKLTDSDKVGPTMGEEILRSAVIALLLSLFGILVYVAFRYEFSVRCRRDHRHYS
jgi:SecD/SecF fusion protein